jgi:hypothetical protein
LSVDYSRPVEALILGVQGRVLGVLVRTETELTMRGVAELAGVSPEQASLVLGRLAELGAVERRDVPPVALVRLVRDNLASQAVVTLDRLRHDAVERLRSLAAEIGRPRRASLSSVRSPGGDAGGSDIDVLAVRPAVLTDDDLDAWTDSLGRWADQASRALGNPVNLVEASTEEVPASLEQKAASMWSDIAAEGLVLAGSSLAHLVAAS